MASMTVSTARIKRFVGIEKAFSTAIYILKVRIVKGMFLE